MSRRVIVAALALLTGASSVVLSSCAGEDQMGSPAHRMSVWVGGTSLGQDIGTLVADNARIPRVVANGAGALHAACSTMLNDAEAAVASCDEAIALKPDYAEAHNNRGDALFELKRLKEALASYDRAVSIKPDYVEAFNNRGSRFSNSNGSRRHSRAATGRSRSSQIMPRPSPTVATRFSNSDASRRHWRATTGRSASSPIISMLRSHRCTWQIKCAGGQPAPRAPT